jgi:hypothetical protein
MYCARLLKAGSGGSKSYQVDFLTGTALAMPERFLKAKLPGGSDQKRALEILREFGVKNYADAFEALLGSIRKGSLVVFLGAEGGGRECGRVIKIPELPTEEYKVMTSRTSGGSATVPLLRIADMLPSDPQAARDHLTDKWGGMEPISNWVDANGFITECELQNASKMLQNDMTAESPTKRTKRSSKLQNELSSKQSPQNTAKVSPPDQKAALVSPPEQKVALVSPPEQKAALVSPPEQKAALVSPPDQKVALAKLEKCVEENKSLGQRTNATPSGLQKKRQEYLLEPKTGKPRKVR